MNTKTIINIKTEKSLKRAAQETAEELGVPLSTAINAFLKQFVRDKEITFSVNIPNAETKRALLEVRQRKGVEKFSSIESWKRSMR